MKFPFCCFSKHSWKTREYINEVRQRDVNALALRYPETQHRVMGLVRQLWFSSSSLTLSCSHIKSMAAVYEHRNAGFSTLWNMHSCQTCQHRNCYVQTRATTCKICPNTLSELPKHTCVHNDTEELSLRVQALAIGLTGIIPQYLANTIGLLIWFCFHPFMWCTGTPF